MRAFIQIACGPTQEPHIKVNLLRTLQREAEQIFEDEVRNCAQQKQMFVELDYKATFPKPKPRVYL